MHPDTVQKRMCVCVCARVREPGASTCVLWRVHLPAFDAFLSRDNNSAGRDESVRAARGHDLDFNRSAVLNRR